MNAQQTNAEQSMNWRMIDLTGDAAHIAKLVQGRLERRTTTEIHPLHLLDAIVHSCGDSGMIYFLADADTAALFLERETWMERFLYWTYRAQSYQAVPKLLLLLTSTDDRLPDNSNTLNPIVLARLRNYNPTNIFRALWVLVAIVKSCIQLDQALGDTDNAAVFLEKEHWIEDPLKWAYEAGEFADVANILWLLRKPEVGIKIEPLEELQNPLFTELAKPVPSRIGTKIIQEMAIDAQAVPAVQVPAASASPARKRGAAPFKGRGPKKAVVIGNDVGKCSLCTRENRECIRPTNLKGPCETCKQLRKRCIQARQGVRKSGPMTSPQSGGR